MPNKNASLGVNLWGLIPDAREDLPGVLQQLRDMGFDSVESMIVPKKRDPYALGAVSSESTFREFIRQVRGYGMDVHSVHVFYKVGPRFLPKSSVVRTIRHLCREYGVECFVFSGAFTDKKGARKWAAYLNDLAEALKGEPCKLLYHNHDQEFGKIFVGKQQMQLLEYFFRLVRSDILLQMDIGWAGNGGDEVTLVKHYANKIYSLHLKDLAHGTRGQFHNPYVPQSVFVPIGEGEIRTAEILNLRSSFPNFLGQIILDQDFSVGSLLQDLQTGYRNVSRML